MSLHCIQLFMYTLFNFALANSLMEQLLLFFYFELHKSSDFGFVSLFLCFWETDDISLFCRRLFLDNYLKLKDLISDKNNVQNFGLGKG